MKRHQTLPFLLFITLWWNAFLVQAQSTEIIYQPSEDFYLSGSLENLYTHQTNSFISLGVNAELYLAEAISLSWQISVGVPLINQDKNYVYFKTFPGLYLGPFFGISLASTGAALGDGEAIITGLILGTVIGAAIPESINIHFDINNYQKIAFYVSPLLFEFNRNFGGSYNNEAADFLQIPQGSYEAGIKLHFFNQANNRRNTAYIGIRNSYNLPNWGIVTGLLFSL
ncbi:hypothetical protein BKI52_26880 [marine bacterium AO1-C]|nr:hypothetical protein BKI52_26880 [marine bacterium AO1-C]